ncbi:MAG: fumarylacetoacetate hydrolase family protein [Candidatus Omnitrophica bacterium]|nr:fumarylacetoacetate hydrolase family protein [Candidatus Omnitrophota bacterium]
MKIIRFNYKKNTLWGLLDGDIVTPLKEEPYKHIKLTKEKISFKNCKLLPPTEPSKIILVGLNYLNHAAELNMPVPKNPIIFLKPVTSLIGNNNFIIYPSSVKRLDYEAELAVIICKKGKNISKKDAHNYIFGYTCLNDITARDLQSQDIQWTRAKSFDTFCAIGPWIETELIPSDIKIQSYLNGKLKQNSSTKEFIFKIDYLVSFISKIMTLLPGDIISTGTPSGVGKMEKGDIIEIKIEGIGTLKNQVV